jgi:hypothetical protein
MKTTVIQRLIRAAAVVQAFAVSASAQTPYEKWPDKWDKPRLWTVHYHLYVLVFAEGEKPGITQDALQTKVELRLRQANL